MLQIICGCVMLAAALIATPGFAVPSACPTVTRQVAGLKFVHDMDGSISIYQGKGFRWHQGLPPKGMVWRAQVYDEVTIAAGEKSLTEAANSIVWSNIDLDGDGIKELVVITNFLQGRAPGYNVTSLHVFCQYKNDVRLCGEAGFSNPPFFNSVLQGGARVPVTHIPSSDTKIGPVVILAVFSGPKRGHTIAVMPYDKVRSGRHVIADIYRWRGPSASFTLLCRAR